jgi:hypothetical protein
MTSNQDVLIETPAKLEAQQHLVELLMKAFADKFVGKQVAKSRFFPDTH